MIYQCDVYGILLLSRTSMIIIGLQYCCRVKNILYMRRAADDARRAVDDQPCRLEKPVMDNVSEQRTVLIRREDSRLVQRVFYCPRKACRLYHRSMIRMRYCQRITLRSCAAVPIADHYRDRRITNIRSSGYSRDHFACGNI